MNDQRDRNFVQHSIDTGLSSIQGNPWLAQWIIASEKEEKPVAKKFSVSLILVIALTIIGTAALAASAGVLDYFFRGKAKPTARQTSLVQSVNVEHVSNGVTTTVTEALAIKNKLALAFSFNADQPVYIHLVSVAVNGVDAPGMDTNVLNQFLGSPFESGPRSVFGGLTCDLEESLLPNAHVTVKLVLLTPGGEIAYKSDYTEEEIHDLIAQGKVVLTGDHGEYNVHYDYISARNNPDQDAIYAQLKPYYLLERELTQEEKREMKRLESLMYHTKDLLTMYGNMKLLDEFKLEFVLDADPENAVEMSRVEVDGMPVHYDVKVEKATLDALGFTLQARLYPVQNGWSEEELEQLSSTFKFYDEMKKPLQFQDTWTEKDSGGWSVDEEGNRYTFINYRMPALENLPAMIYATPDGIGDSAEPLWDDSIMLFSGDPGGLNG